MTSSVSCPGCGGPVVVIQHRAWCVQTYANGGCGRFWSHWLEPRAAQQGFPFVAKERA